MPTLYTSILIQIRATGKEQFSALLEKQDYPLISSFRQTYIDALKHYYFVGGMPEAVQCFSEDADFNEVREIQKRILAAYEQDFSKHAPGIPLKAYADLKAFKLFLLDVGLLGCMAGLRQQTLLDGNALFVEFKGALTEQYACQQLKAIEDLGIYYYTNDRGSCEIDFVLDSGEKIIPLEVKAEVNLRAKSLKTYCEKYKSALAIRSSMADFKQEDWLVNLPLYAVENVVGL